MHDLEPVDRFLAGDLATGTAILRDDVDAAIGLERSARETGTSPKSVMRVFGPACNPTAGNLLLVPYEVQKAAGVHLSVAAGW